MENLEVSAKRSCVVAGTQQEEVQSRNMSNPGRRGPVLLAGLFVICGIGIIILNLISYFQDGRLSTFSVFGFMMIFLGLWLYAQGKKTKSEVERK
jgi:hypothetical protein